MAEVDDDTLALLNSENCFLWGKLEDLEKKYNYLIKKETVMKNILQELQKQRNEAEKNYNRLEEEHAVSCTAAADKIKETEKKLQEINIKYETEVRTKTETETEVSFQKKVIMLQDELNKAYKELNKPFKELNKVQGEIISTQKEITNLHKELNILQKQLYEKADQIRIIQAEQKDREEKLKKSIETQMINNQMVRMRAALTTFEKQKIPDFDPNKRGELWDKYLKTNYKNITLPPNVKGDEMIIQKSAFDDDELTLLENLWQLSPLRKGSLSSKEVLD
ncbi:spindle pole body component 110-like isoform X2 [Tribolium madens]|uniref:spindle pole body component 110-like isoform X2 n=1 Tax=Tribolium madens TaxID=41895 RepID=UPI001CF74A8A|nr:spindle pole body component 110-like isoform X2 [Tribolium madens]